MISASVVVIANDTKDVPFATAGYSLIALFRLWHDELND